MYEVRLINGKSFYVEKLGVSDDSSDDRIAKFTTDEGIYYVPLSSLLYVREIE